MSQAQHRSCRYPTIESELVKLAASGADTIFYASTPKFTAQAIRKAHEMGWKPLQIVITASSQIDATLKPAGLEASTGLVTSLWQKVPNDPIWADDKSMGEFLAFIVHEAVGAGRGGRHLPVSDRIFMGTDHGRDPEEVRRRSLAGKFTQAGDQPERLPSLALHRWRQPQHVPGRPHPWRQAKMASFCGPVPFISRLREPSRRPL
jgi:hypothetical protein